MDQPATKQDIAQLRTAIHRRSRDVMLWGAIYVVGFVLIGSALLQGN